MTPTEKLLSDLALRGYSVCQEFLSPAEATALANEAENLRAAGAFKVAGVGKGQANVTDAAIRRDETLWFDEQNLRPAQAEFWAKLEALKASFNQALYLGLWDVEGHFAFYAPGAFYQKHLDRFRSEDLRSVSCVLYLNPDWQKGDGGELKLHLYRGHSALIEPRGGTLVCFLSDKIEHEVLKTNAPRLSFAGWFRRRSARG